MNISKIVLYTLVLLFISLSIGQFNYKPGHIGASIELTGEEYITGDDGVPRMTINIWGHVKYPGAYLVYDDIDLLTCLSMAGGPLKGSNLSKISIISENGDTKYIDLNNKQHIKLDLKPFDTIKIDEKFSHILLTKTSIIAVVLQLINVIVSVS
tara:strand:+ start:1813 stop:2274 length:462 start_codon:yes stop_codon:yes gene_type:complete